MSRFVRKRVRDRTGRVQARTMKKTTFQKKYAGRKAKKGGRVYYSAEAFKELKKGRLYRNLLMHALHPATQYKGYKKIADFKVFMVTSSPIAAGGKLEEEMQTLKDIFWRTRQAEKKRSAYFSVEAEEENVPIDPDEFDGIQGKVYFEASFPRKKAFYEDSTIRGFGKTEVSALKRAQKQGLDLTSSQRRLVEDYENNY